MKGTEREVGKFLISWRREKVLASLISTRTETDTGRQGEYPETDGRSVVKELGKITP